MLKRVILFLSLLLVAGAAAWIVFRPHEAKNPGAMRGDRGPIPVAASIARKGDLNVTLNALGTVTPPAFVTVRTQIDGQLTEIGFQEGQTVRQGDFLAQIDPRPYEIALAQAEGKLLKDQALLKDAELNLARFQKLVKHDSISRQQVDTQSSLVQQYKGQVHSDQADIDAAKLNLAYCRITAPISGRVGLRQVDVGNYVQTSNTNGIVTLAQTQPIDVIFTLPEDNVPSVVKRMKAETPIEVAAYDRGQTTKLATGKVVSMDNQIDTSTGTFKLRAQFENEDGLLFPNQFVNVRILLDTLRDITLVPHAAIQRGIPGTFVYLISSDNAVSVRSVKLGPTDGENVSVVDGISIGDKVVIDGADKLREGSKVLLPAENKEGK